MAELATRAGTSAPTLCRYESGLVDPSGAVVARILGAAGDAEDDGVRVRILERESLFLERKKTVIFAC